MRLRLVAVRLVPVLIAEDDDGNLAPGPEVEPLLVNSADLDQVPGIVRAGIEQLNSNVAGQAKRDGAIRPGGTGVPIPARALNQAR